MSIGTQVRILKTLSRILASIAPVINETPDKASCCAFMVRMRGDSDILQFVNKYSSSTKRSVAKRNMFLVVQSLFEAAATNIKYIVTSIGSVQSDPFTAPLNGFSVNTPGSENFIGKRIMFRQNLKNAGLEKYSLSVKCVTNGPITNAHTKIDDNKPGNILSALRVRKRVAF